MNWLRAALLASILVCIHVLASHAQPYNPPSGGGSITVGTTPVGGTCTTGYNLYNNGGTLGCQANGNGSTNVQRFTALASLGSAAAPVCQINGCTAGGTGYGTSVTGGSLTLTTNSGKFVCSTYPVLTVNSSAGGAITGTPAVGTAGSCTVMGGTADEVWTASGGLSAGSGAFFSLTWTATAQTYTPTTGIKYAMVYAYGAGGQGGGGASVTSGTASSGGAGGGGGSVNPCFISATQISTSQTVTVGLGGRSGGNPGATAPSNGTIGQAGGATTFGSLCKGWGGGAGYNGIDAATLSGGGGGGGIGAVGGNGASGTQGVGAQCAGSGYAGGTPTAGLCNGGGNGGSSSSAAGVASTGQPSIFGGAGGAAGAGLASTPAAVSGGTGGFASSQGIPLNGGTPGATNTSGGAGGNQSNVMPNAECGAGGGGGGNGVTTTIAGNGGAGGLCAGSGGGGSVVSGTGSAPGWAGPAGDGVLDVVEFF